jgi:hypothetical protein
MRIFLANHSDRMAGVISTHSSPAAGRPAGRPACLPACLGVLQQSPFPAQSDMPSQTCPVRHANFHPPFVALPAARLELFLRKESLLAVKGFHFMLDLNKMKHAADTPDRARAGTTDTLHRRSELHRQIEQIHVIHMSEDEGVRCHDIHHTGT